MKRLLSSALIVAAILAIPSPVAASTSCAADEILLSDLKGGDVGYGGEATYIMHGDAGDTLNQELAVS